LEIRDALKLRANSGYRRIPEVNTRKKTKSICPKDVKEAGNVFTITNAYARISKRTSKREGSLD
jgi:hypothetical protein